MKIVLFVFGLLTLSVNAWGQTVTSNLWLFELEYKNNNPVIRDARKITDNEQYSNQPHFLKNSDSLYFTQALGVENVIQTDVFLYDTHKRQHTNLTNSSSSEYSPTPLPSENGFSVIKVDEKGKQWLWAISKNEQINGKLSEAEPVGYHVWTSDETILAFILGTPHTLQNITLSGHQRVVDENIGASLWPIPGTNMFSYTKNPAPDSQPWTLMAFDNAHQNTFVLVAMPGNSQYMAWTPDAKALAMHGSQIVYWSLAPTRTQNGTDDIASTMVGEKGGEVEQWQNWLDVSEYCPLGGSRLHVSTSGQFLALVCND